MHELGYVLSLGDLTSAADAGDLMYETLTAGARRTETRLMVPETAPCRAESWYYSGIARKSSWYSDWLEESGFLLQCAQGRPGDNSSESSSASD